jgi:plastocyanin
VGSRGSRPGFQARAEDDLSRRGLSRPSPEGRNAALRVEPVRRFNVMHRDLASLAALTVLALTVGVGCPEEPKGNSGPKPAASTHAATTAAQSAAAKEKEAPKEAPAGAEGKMGTATIKGVVNFSGKAPEMKVPKKRKDAEFCKTKEVKYNSVVVNNGKLADVLVRLSNDAVKGDYKAPAKHAEIAQSDCMYAPRIQGVVAGQTIDIKNGDATLHNVHTYKGAESWFNKPQIKGSAAIPQELPDEPKIVKFTCDVHPWMRGFVVVTAHPFFAVSGADGTFAIEKVPAGEFTVEAWHPHYGLKTQKVKVEDGKAAEITFAYDGTEKEPDENKDEMKDLF